MSAEVNWSGTVQVKNKNKVGVRAEEEEAGVSRYANRVQSSVTWQCAEKLRTSPSDLLVQVTFNSKDIERFVCLEFVGSV